MQKVARQMLLIANIIRNNLLRKSRFTIHLQNDIALSAHLKTYM